MTDRSVLTTRELAELLHAHPRTVVVWLKAGRLPGAKAPGGWRVSREQLENFLAGSYAGAPGSAQPGNQQSTAS